MMRFFAIAQNDMNLSGKGQGRLVAAKPPPTSPDLSPLKFMSLVGIAKNLSFYRKVIKYDMKVQINQ